MKRKLKAYTLLELVVVLGILVAITILVLPIGIDQIQQNRASSQANEIVTIMFKQQQSANSRRNNKNYGIAFTNSSYSTFVGNTFATAESFDTYALPGNLRITQINLGGQPDLTFTSGGFRPNRTGTVIVTEGNNNIVIEINSEGFINSYQQ